MTVRVLPYGESALLVEPDDAEGVLALAGAARQLAGVTEVVPAARTVLLVLDPGVDVGEVRRRLLELVVGPAAHADRAEVVLDVVYDGPDLATTAAEVGLDPDGLVRAHISAAHTVAFCGFVPGFAYCRGLPERVQVPRLREPRTRVPAGSVAIAGEFSGVYPRASPGGWRLLGRTDAVLWDLGREPPALLSPGTPVRFRAVDR
ncbi:allophanate hydrolase subunit 1 [uncultured Jatrophihabitans sp.]|uniref:5-oxoprolinase subunit B family protein n=1 Tax=uncultured Jatrophihabitans sp. TaxID=1610747 RepID=UPI0035CAD8E8